MIKIALYSNNEKMKIAFLNVKSSRKECINKDFMSGYGWAFNAGNSNAGSPNKLRKKTGRKPSADELWVYVCSFSSSWA